MSDDARVSPTDQPDTATGDKCPKCGAAEIPCGPEHDDWVYVRWSCGSAIHENEDKSRHTDRCRIAELEARVLRLTTKLRTPHPERDFVRECNDLLAAKDAKISELEATITTLKAEKNQAINDAFDAELAHEVALREIESLKADAAALQFAIAESLKVVDEAYEATGYFRIAETSEQRIRLGLAAKSDHPGQQLIERLAKLERVAEAALAREAAWNALHDFLDANEGDVDDIAAYRARLREFNAAFDAAVVRLREALAGLGQ